MTRQQKYTFSSYLRRAGRRRVHHLSFPQLLFAGQSSLRSDSRSVGEKVSPPPPKATIAASGQDPAGRCNHIDVRVTGERSSCPSAYLQLGANGGVLFLLERQSERSEDQPGAKVTGHHAERRAVGLPGASKLRKSILTERVV